MFSFLKKKSRDVIRGFIVLDARKEILEIRRENRRLLNLYRDALFTNNFDTIEQLSKELDENIAKLDKIELRYFGPKDL